MLCHQIIMSCLKTIFDDSLENTLKRVHIVVFAQHELFHLVKGVPESFVSYLI